MVEILEMPGIFADGAMAKKAIQAWKSHEAKILDQKANAVMLAMAMYPDQAFFSKRPLRKPADFKGLKTRVHSVALASLVAGLGGEPLTVPFAETYTALERGTLDAAITGTKPGFGLRWYEVSKYLVGPISMRPHVSLAVNKATWKRLPPDVQQIMKEEAEKVVEGKAFEAIETWNKEGIDRNVEKGMEHIPFSPETHAAIKDVLRTKVVPDWVKRAGGAEAAKNFNEVVAPLVGFKVNPGVRRRRRWRGPWIASSSGPGTWPASCTSCWPSSSPTTCSRASGGRPLGCPLPASPTRSAATCWRWRRPGVSPSRCARAGTCAST
jgi:TRAP-type C4-dicarboxylate transport system substrate-binding protein